MTSAPRGTARTPARAAVAAVKDSLGHRCNRRAVRRVWGVRPRTGTVCGSHRYENTLHGNSVRVVIGDPDDGRIGYVEQAEQFVTGGVLHAVVEIDGQVAELVGTVEETGRPARIRESLQDAGEQIIAKGSQTQLLANVTMTYSGTTVPLEFAPAFAYDLETRRVDLYRR